MLADRPESHIMATSVPILIIRGQHDVISPKKWAQSLVHLSPNIQMMEVSAAHHGVHYSHPKQVSQLCKSFIIA
jgi:pimeloyl-ACP methyl ester carboxylesterase